MTEERKGEASAEVKKRVDAARKIQEKRYQQQKNIHCNGQMGAKEIEQYCVLDAGSIRLLERSVEKLGLSARAYHRILKISRTIADMNGKDQLELSHVAEAVQYRRNG